ncbi:MAG: FecR domain-containing protein [Bacteroidales bacterium]|nr:FecR domain-containing protein [Bacteroidales bacterium]MBN2748848.1 FecR domain-containing protein [Bacteroidales bacterium]
MNTTEGNIRDFEIVARYLAGEMTGDEVALFTKQLNQSPEKRKMVEEMESQWKAMGKYRKKQHVNTSEAWEKLSGRLEQEELIPTTMPVQRNRFMQSLVRVAAILVMVVGVGSLLFYAVTRITEAPMLSAVTGAEDFTLVQTLSDGSVVYLAHDTKLFYPKEFLKNERNVELNGEAFFDVAHNANQPFTIETETAVIEVLGTAFNVKSASKSSFELLVERGKVRVTLKDNPTQSQIVVAGEKVTLVNHKLNKALANVSAAKWRTNKMQFKDESLANIVKVINSNYGSNILVSNAQLANRRLTVTFYNNSLSTIVELISLTLGVEAQQTDTTIVLTQK